MESTRSDSQLSIVSPHLLHECEMHGFTNVSQVYTHPTCIHTLVAIDLCLDEVFVSTFSRSVKVNKTTIFPLKLFHISIVFPSSLNKNTQTRNQ